MKRKEIATASISSLVDRPLLEDQAFQEMVNEFLVGLRLEQDLIRLRKEQSLSQTQLARKLGVSQPLIARLESGQLTNIELKTLVRIVFALNGSLRIEVDTHSQMRASKARTPKAVAARAGG